MVCVFIFYILHVVFWRGTASLLDTPYSARCLMAGKSKNQHVVKRDDGWAVRGEGNSKDTSHHRTQQDAADAARAIAQNQKSEVLIHGRDNKIRERDSYGNDPHPPKG